MLEESEPGAWRLRAHAVTSTANPARTIRDMPTIQDTTKDPAAKAAAISLLSRGLASQSEVARLAGVSRQLVKHWARDIPLDRNRDAVLTKLWQQALRKRR